MNEGKWRFQATVFPSLSTIIAVLLFGALGVWQLDRAEQKRSLYEEYNSRDRMPVLEWRGSIDEQVLWRRAHIDGRYHDRWLILLDNQVYRGRAGYHVYTPINPTSTDTWMLVNRGWIPAGADRSILPDIITPAGHISVTGRIMKPPYSGILLDGDYIEALTESVLRTQSIELDGLSVKTNLVLQPLVLQLGPDPDTGFIRDWPPPGFGRERNLGYAFQWFTLAAVAIFIYLYLSIKRDASA